MEGKEQRSVLLAWEDQDGKESVVKVRLAVRSMATRKRYFDAYERAMAKAAAKEADDVQALASATAHDKVIVAARIQNATSILMSETRRELFLAIIDTRQNTTEEVALLNSELDSQFWSTVDFEKVEEEVEFFRSRIAVRT